MEACALSTPRLRIVAGNLSWEDSWACPSNGYVFLLFIMLAACRGVQCRPTLAVSYAPKRGFFRMMMKNERRGEVKLFLPNLSNMDLYTI